jgi:hypothetical protein
MMKRKSRADRLPVSCQHSSGRDVLLAGTGIIQTEEAALQENDVVEITFGNRSWNVAPVG